MFDRVVWQEGLFIKPQHFQQNDRYINHEFMVRTRELQSNSWGLFNMSIDLHHLSLGKLVLNEVSGIMPDGTLFELNSKRESLTLNIKPEDKNKSFFLALPITLQNSDEVQYENQNNQLARFVAHTIEEIPNSNAGETSEANIIVAKYNFQLLLEEDLNDSYVNIKLGNIADVSTSGSVSINKGYLPTYLHFHASTLLVAKVTELVNTLSYRASKLSEKLSDATVQVSELGDYLMLQLLNKTDSRLHFYLSQERIHPRELFLELSSLVGELAVFMKKEKRVLEPFVYDHKAQGESFNKILIELHDMLSLVLEQNSTSLPIIQQKYGIYTSPIADKSMILTSSFIFAVKADVDEAKLKKFLQSNLKIGSIETIRDLVNYHLSGFKLKSLATAPRQIPYKVNFIYFKIDLSMEEKEKLTHSGGFAFHLTGEIKNITYAIWAIRND